MRGWQQSKRLVCVSSTSCFGYNELLACVCWNQLLSNKLQILLLFYRLWQIGDILLPYWLKITHWFKESICRVSDFLKEQFTLKLKFSHLFSLLLLFCHMPFYFWTTQGCVCRTAINSDSANRECSQNVLARFSPVMLIERLFKVGWSLITSSEC